MKKFFLLLTLLVIALPAERVKVSVFIRSRADISSLIETGLNDIVGSEPKKGTIELILHTDQIPLLKKLGFTYEILEIDLVRKFREWRASPQGINFGPYYDYYEAVQKLNDIHNTYPSLTTALLDIGAGWEGNTIYAMKVSDNPDIDEGEPALLLDGVHHAREPIGCTITLEFAEYLLQRYGNDPEITWLIDNRELWIVPVVNPDGYLYNSDDPNSDGYWRKNKRDNDNNGYFNESYDGVDLNRNYGYMWGYDNEGSSPNPPSQTYRGPSPFSEPETQTIRALSDSIQPVIALNYHSYSNLLLFPWGYDYIYTPDHNLYQAMSGVMTQVSGYTYGTPWELLYLVNGESTDWMYGEQTEKPKIMAFVPEVGEAFYQPDSAVIQEQFNENLPMNLFVLKAVGHFIEVEDWTYQDQNGSQILDPGDTVFLTVTLRNLGIIGPLFNAGALLQSQTSCAVLLDSIKSYGDIPAFPGAGVSNPTPYVFVLHDSLQNGTNLPFILTIYDDAGFSQPAKLNFIIPDGFLFEDDFEGGLSNWTTGGTGGPWDLTNSSSHSPVYSITESPSGNYQNDWDTWIRTTNPITLDSSLSSASLSFWHRYDIEDGWDYGYVEISTDGSNWNVLRSWTGTLSSWTNVIIDISDYIGSSVYLRFRLWSDYLITRDGWYVDDVTVEGYQNADCPSVPKVVEKGRDYIPEALIPGMKVEKDRILLTVQRAQPVHFYAIDPSGRKYKLANELLSEGAYSFSISGLPAGIYFFYLETPYGSRTLKYLRIKR